MAPKAGIITGLNEDQWRIIYFIRDYYKRTGKCPLVYETVRMNRLHLQELKKLFPAGYLRGACRLAGITYKEGYLDQSWAEGLAEQVTEGEEGKTYEINVHGFFGQSFSMGQALCLASGLGDEDAQAHRKTLADHRILTAKVCKRQHRADCSPDLRDGPH